MCVRVCVCVCAILSVFMCGFVHVSTSGKCAHYERVVAKVRLNICMCESKVAFANMCVYMCVCVCVRVRDHEYLCTQTCLCLCMPVHVVACACVCVCVCVCVCEMCELCVHVHVCMCVCVQSPVVATVAVAWQSWWAGAPWALTWCHSWVRASCLRRTT